MALFNYAIREITAKIVYYGPGLGGKTTNLQRIYESMDSGTRGKLIALATDADRTLFFDFLPLDLGNIGGYRVRFQLYTVPGQVHYNATRKLVLKGVDAIVFVADSQIEMLERNRESFDNMKENLVENNYDFDSIPLVVQFNKQDLPNVATPEEVAESIGIRIREIVSFNTVAIEGKGVFECLKAIVKLTMKKLSLQFQEQPAAAGKRGGGERTAAGGKTPPPGERAPEAPAVETPPLPPAASAGGRDASKGAEPAWYPEMPEPVTRDDMSEVDLEQLLDEEVPADVPAGKSVAREGEAEPVPEEVPFLEPLPAGEEMAAAASAVNSGERAPGGLEMGAGILGPEPSAPAAQDDETAPAPVPGAPGEAAAVETARPPEATAGRAGGDDMTGETQFERQPPEVGMEAVKAAARPGEDLPCGEEPDYGEITLRDYGGDLAEATDPGTDVVSEVNLEHLRPGGVVEQQASAAAEAPPAAEAFPEGTVAPVGAAPGEGGLEPLMNEINLLRDKTEKMENAVSEIQRNIEENRRLLGKMMYLAQGKASEGGAKLSDRVPSEQPKRGFFSRLFGGGD